MNFKDGIKALGLGTIITLSTPTTAKNNFSQDTSIAIDIFTKQVFNTLKNRGVPNNSLENIAKLLKKSNIDITHNYKTLKENKEYEGAIYLKKGRPQIFFIKQRLNKEQINILIEINKILNTNNISLSIIDEKYLNLEYLSE